MATMSRDAALIGRQAAPSNDGPGLDWEGSIGHDQCRVVGDASDHGFFVTALPFTTAYSAPLPSDSCIRRTNVAAGRRAAKFAIMRIARFIFLSSVLLKPM